MILSDTDIARRLEDEELDISPIEWSNIEPASVDLRLGRSFQQPIKTGRVIDTRGETEQQYREFNADSIILEPGDVILAETLEHIEIPNDLCADVVGRSTLGRLFVSVHETAGFGDPGFQGTVTLEMTNGNPDPMKLHAGDRICQIIFKTLTSPAERPYGHSGSQYQNQSGATPSKGNFE